MEDADKEDESPLTKEEKEKLRQHFGQDRPIPKRGSEKLTPDSTHHEVLEEAIGIINQAVAGKKYKTTERERRSILAVMETLRYQIQNKILKDPTASDYPAKEPEIPDASPLPWERRKTIPLEAKELYVVCIPNQEVRITLESLEPPGSKIDRLRITTGGFTELSTDKTSSGDRRLYRRRQTVSLESASLNFPPDIVIQEATHLANLYRNTPRTKSPRVLYLGSLT